MGERLINPIHNIFKQYRKVNIVNPYIFAKPFVSTWRTSNTSTGSSTSTQVLLPLTSFGTYNFIVNWGDGNINTITAWNQAQVLHTYSVAGDYTITITGVCTGFRFNNTGDRLKLLSISSWGSLKLGTQSANFFGCANLSLSSVSDILNLVGTSSLTDTFRGCSSITTINRLTEWNFSSIITLTRTFATMPLFNNPLNGIDTSNVTSMGGFLTGCTIFNQPVNLLDTHNVVDMNTLFQGAVAFKQYIGMWDVSKVNTFTGFMAGKTPSTFPATYLDDIYNGWSTRPVIASRTITFGSAKYTAGASAGRAILTGAPNNWLITDGGI